MVSVLGALIGLAHQETLSRRDTGTFPAEMFTTASFRRLYQLVRVLAGWNFDEDSMSGDPFAATLWVLREHIAVRLPGDDWLPMPPDKLASWAGATEPVVQTIAANTLLLHDCPHLIHTAAALDYTRFAPPVRKRDRWPELMPLLASPPAWPAGLATQWRAALACHILAGSRETAPAALYEAWLTESYNWPKGDLYWWTLSELKRDALLRYNLSPDSSQLFTVPL